MSIADSIQKKLTAALAPEILNIEDQSEQHRGHSGFREGGETHFHVEIVSAAFDGVSRVMRHRKVYEILADELAGSVHALALTTDTPNERARVG